MQRGRSGSRDHDNVESSHGATDRSSPLHRLAHGPIPGGGRRHRRLRARPRDEAPFRDRRRVPPAEVIRLEFLSAGSMLSGTRPAWLRTAPPRSMTSENDASDSSRKASSASSSRVAASMVTMGVAGIGLRGLGAWRTSGAGGNAGQGTIGGRRGGLLAAGGFHFAGELLEQ